MLLSAEIRQFWPRECPDAIVTWFRSGPMPPGGGNAREDEYLHEPGQTELGLKRRGGKRGVEAKGLVAILPPAGDAQPFMDPIEIWCKWESPTLTLDGLPIVRVRKLRWLRKFDTSGEDAVEIPLAEDETPADHRLPPRLGCNVELTKVELRARQVWWTLGFEAFGDLSSVEHSLRGTLSTTGLAQVLAACPGEPLSYPAWLSKHVLQQDLPS